MGLQMGLQMGLHYDITFEGINTPLGTKNGQKTAVF